MSQVLRAEAEARYPYLTTQGHDYKAWAKRIIYRHERGDKELLHVSINFAYEAMGLEVKNGSPSS